MEYLESMGQKAKSASLKLTRVSTEVKNSALFKIADSLEKNAANNAFFAEVWQSQKDFAVIAVPFWAGSQASNAKLGKAFADTLK